MRAAADSVLFEPLIPVYKVRIITRAVEACLWQGSCVHEVSRHRGGQAALSATKVWHHLGEFGSDIPANYRMPKDTSF